MMSRTCQWPDAVGASHASGADASASIWSDCSRTVRSRLSLLAKSLNSHSLMRPPSTARAASERMPDGSTVLG